MPRRRTTVFRSITTAPLRAPWWLSAIIAIGIYALLKLIWSWLGVRTVGAPAQLITVLQYLLPGAFVLSALASLFNRRARPRPVAAGRSAATIKPLAPVTFELLASLDWYCFGQLCAGYLETIGIRAEHTGFDGDCSIELALYRAGEGKPFACARCSSGCERVGVIPIRDLLGVIAARRMEHSMHFSLSGYTPDAVAYAHARHVVLVAGDNLAERIHRLPSNLQQSLLRDVTRGDYTTPTCPRCGIKMTNRHSHNPCMPSKPSWGCVNYPHCRQTLPQNRT